MKKRFFFAVLILVLYNFIGCTKNDIPSEPQPLPSIYKADDSTTGVFNYTGISYDSIQVTDSVFPLSVSGYPSGYHTIFKTYSHQVSGQIRIKKLLSDSSYITLTRPIYDNYDTASIKSGMIFQTDPSYLKYIISNSDTIIWAKYIDNSINIIHSGVEFPDVYRGFIVIPNGDGKFVNGHWEINYPSSGNYTSRPFGNPMPAMYLLSAYHTYHLTCVKQH
jgi:hypothetical protein